MFFNTKDYLDRDRLDELSTFLGSITYQINSYDKWESREVLSANYMNSDYEIIFYVKGGSRTAVEGREYECEPGSLLVLEPFQLVTSINEEYDRVEYYFIHFDVKPLHVRQQLQRLLTANGAVIHKNELSDLSQMFEKLYAEKCTKKAGYLSVVTSGLIRILVEIIRAQQERRAIPLKPAMPDSRTVETVRSAITYMEDSLQKPINMKETARHLNVSGSYLYKSFVEVMGTAPSRFAMQLKINKARELLSRQNYTVERIGELLGFSSACHFSNTFKNMTGTSPKQYQKRIRSGQKGIKQPEKRTPSY